MTAWSFLPASNIGELEQVAFASAGLLCVVAGALMNHLSYAAFIAAKRADEAALDFRAAEQQARVDLEAMRVLYDVSISCISSRVSLDTNLRSILNAAISVTGANKGDIQLVDPDTRSLVIAAHRGLSGPFLSFFFGLSLLQLAPLHGDVASA